MALSQHFYHKSIRKYVTVFGTLFNEIQIRRENGDIITVPIAYGSKEKWYRLITENKEQDRVQSITLPRISYRISAITYDGERKLGSVEEIFSQNDTDNTQIEKVFMPVPYNIDFETTIWAKNMDDLLQIKEQIIPFFSPYFTVTINELDDPLVIRDVPITLNNVTLEDDSEGTPDDFRIIQATLDFTMKTHLYGPVKDGKLIREAIVFVGLNPNDENIKHLKYTVVPDPIDANIEDDYGFTETWEDIDV